MEPGREKKERGQKQEGASRKGQAGSMKGNSHGCYRLCGVAHHMRHQWKQVQWETGTDLVWLKTDRKTMGGSPGLPGEPAGILQLSFSDTGFTLGSVS